MCGRRACEAWLVTLLCAECTGFLRFSMENKITCPGVASSKFTIPYVLALLWAALVSFLRGLAPCSLQPSCGLPLLREVLVVPGGCQGLWLRVQGVCMVGGGGPAFCRCVLCGFQCGRVLAGPSGRGLCSYIEVWLSAESFLLFLPGFES